MKTVVFVAPLFRENTNRYVRALGELDDVVLATIGQEPVDALPAELRRYVAAHAVVDDSMSGAQLAEACRALTPRVGRIDRLLGMLEQLQVPLAEARDAVGIEGMRTDAALRFRDKSRMKDALGRAGLPVARHKLVENDADAWTFVDQVGFPIVVKPPAGLGAKSTWRVSGKHELGELLRALRPSPAAPLQAEEFVVGHEYTCETVSIGGRAVWHSGTRYVPSPLEVLENAWMQYCVLLPREADDARWTAFQPINREALVVLGMDTGLSHMEWFRRPDGRAVISEVGARPPGAMIMPLMSHAHEVDMVRVWAKLVVHEQFDAPTRKHAAGVAFFRGQGRGDRVTAVRGLAEAQEAVGRWVVEARLPEVGQPKGTGYEGEGHAIVVADDTRTVVHALGTLVRRVRVELG